MIRDERRNAERNQEEPNMSLENIDAVEGVNSKARIVLRKCGRDLSVSLTKPENNTAVFHAEIAGRSTWRRDGFLVSTREWSGVSLKSENGTLEWSASLANRRRIFTNGS